MSAIFISYSSKDNELAAALLARLRAKGYHSVFLDQDREDGIPLGDKWEVVLYRELRSCQVVIALVGDDWSKSKWCFAEATHAREKGKTILGLKIQADADCSLLTDSQLVDFTAERREEGYARLWSTLDTVLDWRGHLAWDAGRSPYPGLSVFEEQDAPIYFGRDEVIHELKETLERLRRQRHKETRFVVVLGASGSGKSSLVRAGLVPLLRSSLDDWVVVGPLIPQDQFLNRLAQGFAQTFADHGVTRDWKEFRDILASARDVGSDDPLSDLIGDLRMRTRKPNAMVLLIVDQLEELLSRPERNLDASASAPAASASSAASGLAALRRLLDVDGKWCMVLGTLRSDFLSEFQKQAELKDLGYEAFQVPSMREADFASVIEGPAVLANLSLEPGLTNVVVDDTVTNDALPLLAFTLNKMWTMFGHHGRLTIDQYRTGLGSLQGALERWAEDALPSRPLTPAHERILQAGFLSLVRVSEEGQLVRQRARWQDLPPAAGALLEPYVEARLLVSRSERPDGGETVVEVAHETLFRAWARLRTWLHDRENQEFLAWREGVHRQLTLWNRNQNDDSLLLQPVQLKHATRWLKKRADVLNAQERRFVDVSVRVARKGPRRRAAAVLLFLVLAAVASWRFAVKSGWYEFYKLDATTKTVINQEFIRTLQATLRTGVSTYTVMELANDAHFERSAAELPEVVKTLTDMKTALGTLASSDAKRLAACSESTDDALAMATRAGRAKAVQRVGYIPALIGDGQDRGVLVEVVESCRTTSPGAPQTNSMTAAAERIGVLRRRMADEFAQIDRAAAELRARNALKRAVEEKVNVSISYGDDFKAEIEQSGSGPSKADEPTQKGLSPEQAEKAFAPAVSTPKK